MDKEKEKELNSLRKFKNDVEATCSTLVVIDALNEELEEERNKLNEKIQEWKCIAEDKKNHINYIYNELCLTILFSLEIELLNYGQKTFNIHDKCEEIVSAPDIIKLLKEKLLGLIKIHNTENSNYTFYYHKTNNELWFIVGDAVELIHYENMIDLVCPTSDMYYTECNCNRCLKFKEIIEEGFINGYNDLEDENDFDY